MLAIFDDQKGAGKVSLKQLSSPRIFGLLPWILFSASVVGAQLVERPLITARHAVVTSDEPLASMAGMRILQEGGNAFDPAGAASLALGRLHPPISPTLRNPFPPIHLEKHH